MTTKQVIARIILVASAASIVLFTMYILNKKGILIEFILVFSGVVCVTLLLMWAIRNA